MASKKEMSFLGHLEVLRWHILRAIGFIVLLSAVAFFFKGLIFDAILFAPKNSDFISYQLLCSAANKLGLASDFCHINVPLTLQSRTMGGQFSAHIWGSICSGLILGFPYLIYEMWKFIKPALHQHEKKKASGFVTGSSILFLIGVVFGYFIICPLSINFLGHYSVSEEIKNHIDLSSYISLVLSSSLGTGLVFELPILIFYLVKLGLVDANMLKQYRKIALVLILFLSAVITPPDLLSQILVSVPLYLLYEISIIVALGTTKTKKS